MSEEREKYIVKTSKQSENIYFSLPRPNCNVCDQYMIVVDVLDISPNDFIDLEFLCFACQKTQKKARVVFEPTS